MRGKKSYNIRNVEAHLSVLNKLTTFNHIILFNISKIKTHFI